ncbi:MAG: ATP-binding cassette domain-containing protein, partial [Candidatus Limiplasma sp.]|nr:ATP-binding cassette domain-containing protein [Candidatus Limiplasma sp.]
MLTVKDLKTYFYTDAGCARAVDGVSFHLEKGHVLGIVGESGCGKSVTSLSVMGLLDPVTARVEGGQILFHDRDLLKLSPEEMR